ncbi:MAG: hypothetical protein HY548_02915 [Elusimicrobia bacterium]|nr:hypothetical protein [Elusimicrobiota bacterium]
MKKKSRDSRLSIEEQNPSMKMWGYLSGGALIVLGLIVLSIALGLALRTSSRGIRRMAFPGPLKVNMRMAGVYIGLFQAAGKDPLPVNGLAQISFGMFDENGGPVLLERSPAPQMIKLGTKTGVVLFQCEVPAPGPYSFRTGLAGDFPAPRGEILLIHESVGHNRADMAAGVMFCLFLAGFGIYILLRTNRKAGKPNG